MVMMSDLMNGNGKMQEQLQYLAIDLKSFYASVECVERGLDALDACLVVADESRTNKTICLAVSPALKAFGVSGRPRLFEVERIVRDVNRKRGRNGTSSSGRELAAHSELALTYIVATPRMRLYIDYSARIYGIYLRYIAPEDILVYSIDEVIIDLTGYLSTYKKSAYDLAMQMVRDVIDETGITATVGIGTNMYLSKIAMDIVAKKMPPDKNGVRIAELDELSFRRQLWTHTPLTDFWRVGHGVARRLEAVGLYTMGDVARASLRHEDWFFREFGVNAELLIDHAWGREPVTMDAVKSYRPVARSMSSGQMLQSAYSFDKALVVALEMADNMALDLVEKGLLADRITLTIGYDSRNFSNPIIRHLYKGRITTDHYGRPLPCHSHGTSNFGCSTSSSRLIMKHVETLFRSIVDPMLFVRRLSLSVSGLHPIGEDRPKAVQLELFTDYKTPSGRLKAEALESARERRRQSAIINLRRRFGRNVILTGLNYADGATQKERNKQIGGHKA